MIARILIVDEDEEFTLLARELFERLDHEVLVIDNAEGGLDFFERYPFDLVIAHGRLQTASGLSFVQQMRDRQPDALLIVLREMGEDYPRVRNAAPFRKGDDLFALLRLAVRMVEDRKFTPAPWPMATGF